jgi:8-oxo-dGTP pyrophosphatase MutT (NUDIX family)
MIVAIRSTPVQPMLWIWESQQMPEPEFLTSEALARALGISRTTVWRWQKAGMIRPAFETPKGQARWVLGVVRRQLHLNQAGEPLVPEPATKPEYPVVVAAVVTSHLGVLAGRRNDGKPPWTFISGKIQAGESQVDAAIREVKEETGLEVRAGNNEIGRRLHPVTNRWMIYLACTPVGGTDVFVGDEEELAEVRWLSLDEVDVLMPDMFEPVRQHLGRLIS